MFYMGFRTLTRSMVPIVMSLGGVMLSGLVVAQEITLPLCPISQITTWNDCIGVMTLPDGEKYIGGFRHGKLHGRGTNTFASGEQYDGDYKDGMANGHGKYTWPNGKE